MTQAFFWFTRDGAQIWLPGAPFLVGGVLMGLALVIFVATRETSGPAHAHAGE